MYNKETVIRLNTLDDVQEFVGAASKCDFDIDLKYRQILIDAKSLLGVIGIGTNNDFKVCYMGDDQASDNVLWESFFLELSIFYVQCIKNVWS
mgnify:CR=1 FL=1